jgi:hypothetical protein
MSPVETTDLIAWLGSVSKDPLSFVLGAFEWKKGELANHEGPEPWQRDVLISIRDGLDPNHALQLAVASGHGVGKSALVSWIILWGISTMPDARGVVTANTENQLKTKTWVELAIWYRRFIGKELFDLSATRLCARDPEHSETWRLDCIPWSERSTEAFAGLHNQGRRILVMFDEASAIPDIIHETTEGALTDRNTQILWMMCGNPTRASGRFHAAFHTQSHRWHTTCVDARSVRFTNKDQIQRWIDDYGLDSDFVRVRVLGKFPRVSARQFISRDVAEAARVREARVIKSDALVIGVDVARFGDDATRIVFRVGRDARTYPSIELRGADTMAVAARVAEEAREKHCRAIFVDGGGVGGGVVDRLRQLRFPVFDVQFGGKPDRLGLDFECANKRAEMYAYMREWLAVGGIEDSQTLVSQLCSTEYSLNVRDAIQLERKEDLKKRLPSLGSPDWADALALTFAYPTLSVEHGEDESGGLTSEYDPFGAANEIAWAA